ncbi:hypothetical protein [Thalassotalea crassostreae]|uniref:hypothetical protein n=2 Tax=Thalassotalea crassostreae TaxID=1763536 RepID=UPI0008381D4B|nr:hypothetical protein [Thalassotalea crassostreae]
MRLLSFIACTLFVTFMLLSTSFAQTNVSDDKMLNEFSKIHQELMPKVAVADMFYGCMIDKKQGSYSIEFLINEMDKTELADKLQACLGEDTIASNAALNYGIKACFIDQMSGLTEEQQKSKLVAVDEALANLPIEERKRSFTQCVNNQTLSYMK